MYKGWMQCCEHSGVKDDDDCNDDDDGGVNAIKPNRACWNLNVQLQELEVLGRMKFDERFEW
jgi:hypothetical protein